MSRIVSLSTLLAALLVLAAPAVSGAAQPGWKLGGWLTAARTKRVAPGATVRVVVAPARGRGAPPRRARVTVALTRGKDGRTLKRRTLRSGVFSAKLPAATGVSYRLSATAGRRLLRRVTLTVPAPGRSQGTKGDDVVKPPVPPAPCTPGSRSVGPASGTLTGDKSTLRYGETLTLTFTNTSPTACLIGGAGFRLERSDGGVGWVPAGFRVAVATVARSLKRGESYTSRFTAIDELFDADNGAFPLQPGRYRAVVGWQADTQAGETVSGVWQFALTLDDDSRCGQPYRTAAARLTIGPNSWGEGLVRLANEGGTCLRLAPQLTLERVLGDGTTEFAATLTHAQCSYAGNLLPPRNSGGYEFPRGEVPPLLAPGRYRATTTVTSVAAGAPDQALPVTLDFTLDEPLGGRLPDPILCPIP